jgi:hypothetical protein
MKVLHASILILFIALFTGHISLAQAKYTLEWNNQEYNQVSSCAHPYSTECQKVRLDSENNLIFAGTSLENDNYDFLVLKYTNNGTLLWKQQIDISNGSKDHITGIFIDTSDNIIITGVSKTSQYISKSVIIKLNKSGNVLWESDYSDEYSRNLPHDMEVDSLGNIFLTGTIDDGFYPHDIFVCKFDANGTFMWDTVYGPEDSTGYHGMTLKIIDDSIISLGISFTSFPSDSRIVLLKHSLEGNLWFSNETSYEGIFSESSHIDNAGNSYIGLFGDFKVIKYDPSGNELWQFEVPTNLPDNVTADEVHDIITDSEGNVYITGRHYGENYENPSNYTNGDFQVNKISSEGNSIYSYRYENLGANAYDGGNKLFLGNNGYLVIGGESQYEEGGDTQYTAIVLDELGEPFDIVKYHEAGEDNAITSVVMDNDLNFYVTGTLTQKYKFTGTLDTDNFSKTEAKIKVYPNPFLNEFQIETKAISGMAEFILFDFKGSIVYRTSFENIPQLTIDTQSIPNGFYFYKLTYGDKFESGKLIKK